MNMLKFGKFQPKIYITNAYQAVYEFQQNGFGDFSATYSNGYKRYQGIHRIHWISDGICMHDDLEKIMHRKTSRQTIKKKIND